MQIFGNILTIIGHHNGECCFSFSFFFVYEAVFDNRRETHSSRKKWLMILAHFNLIPFRNVVGRESRVWVHVCRCTCVTVDMLKIGVFMAVNTGVHGL